MKKLTEVILNEDIDKLGKKWERVKVRRGFFQNYLLPTGKAILATPETVRQVEQRQVRDASRAEKLREEALSFARRLESLRLEIKVPVGEGGKLFGAVTAGDIEEALKKEGVTIKRKKLELEEPVKKLGVYRVKAKIAAGVEAWIQIQVIQK